MTTNSTKAFLAPLVERERELSTSGPQWLRRLRHAGRERFLSTGFPTTREEDWRGTSVSPIARGTFRPATGAAELAEQQLPAGTRSALGGPRLVFLDGRPVPALSSPAAQTEGLWVSDLQRALIEIPDRVKPFLERRAAGTQGCAA
jgi:Fe-S cluster assembly protein SufD